MSRPTRGRRRLGFSVDAHGRPMTAARDGVWSEDVQSVARWVYLQVLTNEYPHVLTSLATIPLEDVQARETWAQRWGLTAAWCRAYADATQHAWQHYPMMRGRAWFQPAEAGVFSDGDLLAVPSRPLKDPQHFVWLAHFQAGRPWLRISAGPPRADIKTVREAAQSLAVALRLPLRPTRPGRPATPKH
jgi:hypothetical protein